MSGVARVAAMFFVAIESYFRNGGEDDHSKLSTSNYGQHSDTAHLVTGLILARAGSKGIPHKNVAILNGHPLIHWALEAMIESGVFHTIWVSTNDPKLKEYLIANYKDVKIHDRAPYTATDEATSISAVQEFITSHPEIETNIICLVQATSPFIQSKYLTEGFDFIQSNHFDSIFSVTRQFKLRWSEITNRNQNMFGGHSKALNFNPFSRPRRQDWPGELVENGMFYFTKKDLLLRGAFQGERSSYVEIPKERSWEIDSPEDLIFANILMSTESQRLSQQLDKVKYFTETENHKEL